MTDRARAVDVSNNPDLLRIAEEVLASRQPRLLRRENEDLALVVPISLAATHGARPDWEQELDASIWHDAGIPRPSTPWASYDPARVRAALRESAGALAARDNVSLLRDLHAERGQNSSGRPG
jgi:hypothetical protein